jgi:DNA-damage-inducible protein J
MTENTVVRARINRGIKEKVLPIESFMPNEETIAAMQEARKGKLKSFASIDDLMTDLNAND